MPESTPPPVPTLQVVRDLIAAGLTDRIDRDTTHGRATADELADIVADWALPAHERYVRALVTEETGTAAASLKETTANLTAYIETRAAEIAEPRLRRASEQARAADHEWRTANAAMVQRKDDLIKELRRQLDAQVKQNERLNREVKETRAAIQRVEALKVWENEDRKKFVFADDLWSALKEAGPDAAAPHVVVLTHNGQHWDVTHPPACHVLPYGQPCALDELRDMEATDQPASARHGTYEVRPVVDPEHGPVGATWTPISETGA